MRFAPLLLLALTVAAPAQRAIAVLTAELGHALPDRRLSAARELATHGEKALPVLRRALAHAKAEVRRAATDALGELGETARPALLDLLTALNDKDAWVRAGAATALGRMGPVPKEVATALAKASGDQDLFVRVSALESLARKKITQDKAVLCRAALAGLAAHDSGWAAKRYAVHILRRHGRDHKPARPHLLELLRHPPEGMWDQSTQVVELLVGLGAASAAVGILGPRLDAAKRGSRRRAIKALALTGKAAIGLVPKLEKIARQDKDKGVREDATKALARIRR